MIIIYVLIIIIQVEILILTNIMIKSIRDLHLQNKINNLGINALIDEIEFLEEINKSNTKK